MNAFKSDIFESNARFVFEEASGEVDGKHILGKIKGPFFVPNGVSRNNRFYTRGLWEKVIANPNIQKKLSERRMLGTIGHEQKLNDSAILEGRISHIVTRLAIAGESGDGEALIIDTPAGRVLNTLLRAGSKLFVSSRADGSFNGEQNGIPKVDEDTYQLETFDFVVDPGFLQANPSLVESLNDLEKQNNNKNKGAYTMEDTRLLESLAKENGALKNDVSKATSELADLKNKNTVMVSENNALKAKLDKQLFAEKQLAKYHQLGTPEEIEKVLDLSEAKLGKYKSLGSIKDLEKALESASKLVEQYQAIGTPKEINEALDKSIVVVQSYKDFGSPAELKEAFDKFESKVVAIRAEKSKARISELAKELKVSEEKIKSVYGKLTEVEIRKLFSNVTEGTVRAPARPSPSSTYVKPTPGSRQATTVPVKRTPFNVSPGARLMETFCPPDEKK